MNNNEKVRAHIRKEYGKIATKKNSCSDGGCGCIKTNINVKDITKKLGYNEQDFYNIPYESNMGLGCGNPVAVSSLKEGETVLDLGSGGGFDCFVARKLVGDKGFIIGVDMTPEMIKLSRENLITSGYKNIEFRLGEIENLPVVCDSIDVVISNCVINLSLDKEKVFKEIYRVLKKDGRVSISDVVSIAPLPDNYKNNLSVISGCIGGAESIDKLKNILEKLNFKKIKITIKDNSDEIVSSWLPSYNVEKYVASAFIEAQK
jgi:ubiquinone/menaquinone biosynthesis C-methylase UbiE